jgi:hypothetical protein
MKNRPLKLIAILTLALLLSLVPAMITSVNALPTDPIVQHNYNGWGYASWQISKPTLIKGTYCGMANFVIQFNPNKDPDNHIDITLAFASNNAQINHGALYWEYAQSSPVVYGDFVVVQGQPTGGSYVPDSACPLANPITVVVHNVAPYYVIVYGSGVWFIGTVTS